MCHLTKGLVLVLKYKYKYMYWHWILGTVARSSSAVQ